MEEVRATGVHSLCGAARQPTPMSTEWASAQSEISVPGRWVPWQNLTKLKDATTKPVDLAAAVETGSNQKMEEEKKNDHGFGQVGEI